MPQISASAGSIVAAGAPGVAVERGSGYDEHRAKSPPPDLPSLLLDARIVYLGMPLVSAVTELIIAELLYLQYKDRFKPINMYINSTGTTRADGESVGFETEGTAIFDTMSYIGNEINTVAVGVAIGQSCMLLSAGTKGHRFMLPHATAMLHQPRVPPTGQRQAVEIAIKWKEVLAQKNAMLEILSKTTGHSTTKLDKDMQRPLYMRAADAIEYGVIDRLVPPQKASMMIDKVKSADQYDKEAGLVTRPASQF
jgi:ATP-dependent Clp protease protease subunit